MNRHTRIRRMLLNPRYAGIKTHLGKRVGPGNWAALVDEDTHRRVVAELSDPSRMKVTSFERKYVGSGVYRCGVCGATMRVSFPGRNQGRKYTCSARSCVMRSGQPVDDYVENVVLERLSEPDANLLIAKRGVDVGKLQDRRAGWVTKLDRLVDLLDDGTLDGPKARQRAAKYKSEIAEIDTQLAAAARTSPTTALLATGKELRKRWAKLTPGVRRDHRRTDDGDDPSGPARDPRLQPGPRQHQVEAVIVLVSCNGDDVRDVTSPRGEGRTLCACRLAETEDSS